jgi:hypothetical protein
VSSPSKPTPRKRVRTYRFTLTPVRPVSQDEWDGLLRECLDALSEPGKDGKP